MKNKILILFLGITVLNYSCKKDNLVVDELEQSQGVF